MYKLTADSIDVKMHVVNALTITAATLINGQRTLTADEAVDLAVQIMAAADARVKVR